MNQFFTKENLKRFMSENSSSLIQIEDEAIMQAFDFNLIFEKLKSAILESQFGGMLSMFGGAAALEPLKPQFEVKFKEIIHETTKNPKFVAALQGSSSSDSSLSSSIDSIVTARLNELTPQMVKTIIEEMIRDHLGWLVIWGGVFGALIGLISTLF